MNEIVGMFKGNEFQCFAPSILKKWKESIFKIVDQRIKFYSQNTNLLPLNLNPLSDIKSRVSRTFIESMLTRPQTMLLLFYGHIILIL